MHLRPSFLFYLLGFISYTIMLRILFALFLLCMGCRNKEDVAPVVAESKVPTVFNRLTGGETGIVFRNDLTVSEDFDVFRYRNFYNGGGVGIGDFNNDGLADVYLTANMGDNKLFLNKGDWKFEDITKKAGVSGTKVWSTGVSIADINADGLLDIYVSNSGDIKGDHRENELFINNGDLTFTDRAEEYGLADKGFSTHAAFFDFDKDGDLDCYVLNNSFRPISTLGFKNLRDKRDTGGGHRLYRNDKGHYVDISEAAHIYGSVIGFGLGVTVGDVNQDNWPDLYVSNDFYERDYLYINNHDGTFKESLEQYIGHLSMFSMGADLADINNDGYPDIFSTDMLPQDNYRLKTMTSFETYDVYQLRLNNGYYHQFMRNMLQLNNQNGTFSEVGELAGVSATDWSWGALIADFDNDSYKDIFVCNGIYKDVTDQDFVEFLGSSDQIKDAMAGKKIDFKAFVDNMSSNKQRNFMFNRTGNLQFTNVAKEWGLDDPSFSNGAAYGDMDNDGDLDLIVNNVNQELFIYRNNSDTIYNRDFISLTFDGPKGNVFGLGTTVKTFLANGETVMYNHMPIRGFQSSMDYKMIIGLGQGRSIDSICVTWPDDKVQWIDSVKLKTAIKVKYTDAKVNTRASGSRKEKVMLREVTQKSPVVHTENDFNDFDRDRLLYHMLSTQGPAFAKADLNSDGMDDFFLGGATGFPARLYLQQSANDFRELNTPFFATGKFGEDIAAEFFDADGDGDSDLYVVTGGSEHSSQSPYTRDLFYINTSEKGGEIQFLYAAENIPTQFSNGSCIKPCDIDNDGDLDLFIGTHSIVSYYGVPADQTILLNDGHGKFKDVTASIAPELKRFGMVSDAVWFDYDGNKFPDLMVVGEWIAPTLFVNNGKSLVKTAAEGLENQEGWWNSIDAADLDNDGDLDFVLGNLGLNSKFKPTAEFPVKLYVNDFDQNGSVEPIFSSFNDGKEYPIALRQDLIKQMSSMKKKFVYYKDYANKTLQDIFDPKLLANSTSHVFRQPLSCVMINNDGGSFLLKPLPVEAQFSPIFSSSVVDLNGDGIMDVVVGGNLFSVKPEVGRYDAMHGLVLLGKKDGSYQTISSGKSGVFIKSEIRQIAKLKSGKSDLLVFVTNNDSLKVYMNNEQ